MYNEKVCPMMSSPVGTVSCLKDQCALWHSSQECSMLVTAMATDSTATILDEVIDELKETGLAVEDIAMVLCSELREEDEDDYALSCSQGH